MVSRDDNGLRIAVETGRKTIVETQRESRAHLAGSILRFITHLGRDSEADMMYAVADAAAIWFQVAVRVYHRTLSGHLVLYRAFQPEEVDDDQRRIRRDLIPQLQVGVPRRVRAAKWTWPHGETYVVGLGTGPQAYWLLMLHGARSRDAADVFAAVSQPLSQRLDELGVTRVRGVQSRLASQISSEVPLVEVARLTTIETAAATGAGNVRLLLRRGSAHRTLATWRAQSQTRSWPNRERTSPRRLVRLVDVDSEGTLALDIRAGAYEFDASTLAIVDAIVASLRKAVSRAGVQMLREPQPGEPRNEFEHRLEEEISRAKRYDLRLSLVVVSASDVNAQGGLRNVGGLLRKSLRSSDVVGRLGPGALGILLPHTDASVMRAIVRRLEQQLTTGTTARTNPWLLGTATLEAKHPTSRAMVAKALRAVRPISRDR